MGLTSRTHGCRALVAPSQLLDSPAAAAFPGGHSPEPSPLRSICSRSGGAGAQYQTRRGWWEQDASAAVGSGLGLPCRAGRMALCDTPDDGVWDTSPQRGVRSMGEL